jgi:flagellar basal-body rod protein FlgB
MELFDTTQAALEAAMRGSAARQHAIAQNLANANTPGYRRVEVDFQSALKTALADPGTTSHALDAMTPTTEVDRSAVLRMDGNSVDIDSEAAAEAQNGLLYEGVAQVMKARIDIIESAIGVR